MAVISTGSGTYTPERLIAAATGGATSDEFTLPGGRMATIVAGVLAGAEEAHLEIKNNDGNFVEVFDSSLPLTATGNATVIAGQGIYRVVKDATAGSGYVDIYNAQFKRRS